MFLMYDDGTKQERFLLEFIPLKQHWFLFIYLFLIDRLTVGLWSKVAEQAHYFFFTVSGIHTLFRGAQRTDKTKLKIFCPSFVRFTRVCLSLLILYCP